MSRVNIEEWRVDDDSFWKSTGKAIAIRNLCISVPCLLLSFAVWIMWGIIITKLKAFGYNFGMITPDLSPGQVTAKLKEINTMYYTLPAIAGLAGATLRIPNSFLIAVGGGRNVIFITTALLLIPAVGLGFALRDINTSYMTFAILAALSGLGGGNFASSMSNISFFFPKRMQGTLLGINAGIGNLGVGIMQKTIPWVIGFLLFSVANESVNIISGDALARGQNTGWVWASLDWESLKESVTIIPNNVLAGVQNAGWVWVPPLVICVIAAFFGMNNIITGTPHLPTTIQGVAKTLFMVILGLVTTAIGAYMLVGLKINMWIVLPVVIITTVMLMKFATPGEIRDELNKQFAIFSDKHNWIMTVLYIMTFGSFIGFSAAFPKLCQDVFVYSDPTNPTYVNPNAPNFLAWVFLGPVIGALVRPLGGWLSDKINSGSRVTAISTIIQIFATVAVAIFVKSAKGVDTPETYWWPFFICFMVLFMSTGIGNGSIFRSIPYIFSKELAGPVLGWTSAVAAYGSFITPGVFGKSIKAGNPEMVFYGFAIFYVLCLILNWWYYDRKNSGIKC